MVLTLLLVESADPTSSWIVFTVSTEYMMNLIDEKQRKLFVSLFACPVMELQEIANGERVSP
jgi:hypothetical protein